MRSKLNSLTLPLIGIVTVNLVPSFTLRPPWFVALALFLLAARTWLELTHRKMPPRWVQWMVQGSVGVAVWQHYHSLFGDEAAGTWLTLLTVLKLFELRTKRDYFITALLCFLMLMSVLLLDQSLLLSIFLIADALLIVGFFYALEEEQWDWQQLRKLAMRPLGLMLRVIPLLILIFILFPRFSTGFGTGGPTGAKTGITDRLRPGSVSQLTPSDELVFRATFLNADVPPRQSLYWRGAVLNLSTGLNWERSDLEELRRPPLRRKSEDEIEIYLEPGFEKFLFTLENTVALHLPSDLNRTRVGQRSGEIFELSQPLQTRERYYLESGPESTAAEDMKPYLKVAEKPSGEVLELLKPYRNRSTAEKVQGVLQHFRSGGFTYSLQPPPVNSMDEFLFKTKVGFCEHFAGTMATLLRHLQVPSRVIVGFQGGSPSFLDNYITVRAHDAHAWLEYYDDLSNRWRRVDPTVTVALSGLNGDAEGVLGRMGVPAWVPGNWRTTYLKARALVDEVEASWIGFLIRFDLAKQKELLTKLGMEAALFRVLPMFLILAIILVLAILYFIEAQGREHLNTEELLYRKLLRALKRCQIEKQPQEGPLTLMARIENANSKLAAQTRPVLEALMFARYSSAQLTAAEAAEISRRIRSLTKT